MGASKSRGPILRAPEARTVFYSEVKGDPFLLRGFGFRETLSSCCSWP